MGFAGNLQTLAWSEVVQTLHRIKAEGVLRLVSPVGGRDVVFAQGSIIGVDSRDGGERVALTRRLRALGRITADGEVSITRLVVSGQLDQGEVDEIVHRQALEELFDLATWEVADFIFHEAGESQEFADLIARHQRAPLRINLDSILLESARRLDEWALLKDAFTDDDLIQPVAGREPELERFRTDETGCLVIPRLVGVRAVDDLLHESSVTRYELYSLLATLQDRGLIVTCEPGALVEHAAALAAGGDLAGAAQVYRRMLARDASDAGLADLLSACLDQLPASAETAACHAQLALAHLGAGRGDEAVQQAGQAVALAKRDPELRMIQVRCLIGSKRTDEATTALLDLARLQVDLGRLAEACDTCLKVLQLRPDDADAKRELVRIHAITSDAGSEDVVVCAQCSAVNKREQSACATCHAPLHLTCLACGRVVSVSDRICVFCGVDPHAKPKGATTRSRALAVSGPSTDRIVNAVKGRGDQGDRGSAYWRVELQKHLGVAREHEAAGRIEPALAAWKEVARLQNDNPELSSHIRELENLTHDRFIEHQIELGHGMRRQRRYWRAIRAYRAAQRGLGVNDQRCARLAEIIASTARSHRRILGIYAAAFVVIIAVAVAAAKPYFDLQRITGRCAALGAELASAPPLDIAAAGFEIDELVQRTERLPSGLRGRAAIALDPLRTAAESARERARVRAHAEAEAELGRSDPAAALRALATITGPFGDDTLSARLQERAERQLREQADLTTRVGKAPALLAEAEAHEQQARPGAALRAYQEIADLPANESSTAAKAGIARLTAPADTFARALADAVRLAETDLAKGAVRLAGLQTDAVAWDRGDELHRHRQAVAARSVAASAAWKALSEGGDEAALQAYIMAHPGAPESDLARARQAQTRTATRTRAAALASYRGQMQAKDWEGAHAAATALGRTHVGQFNPGEVALPLVIVSQPAGAAVSADGTAVGITPLIYTYPLEGGAERLSVTLVGHTPASGRLADLRAGWRWEVALERQSLWSVALGKPVVGLLPLADGVVAVAGSALTRLGAGGAVGWRHALAGEEGMGGMPAMRPLLLEGGKLAVPGDENGITILDANGATVRTYPTRGPARGVAGPYRNDLLGGRPRLAVIADALHAGDLAADLPAMALPAPALSGPLVISDDVDRLLVLADIRGRLLGVEESTQRMAWTADLRASEVGTLVPLAPGMVAMVLDGSRLVCWQVTAGGARERWVQPLEGAALGAPILAEGIVHLAAGTAVVRNQADGTPLSALPLPSPATAQVAAGDGMVVIGCRQHLAVFVAGRPRWSTPLHSPAQAVTVSGGLILVGLADGTVSAYAP